MFITNFSGHVLKIISDNQNLINIIKSSYLGITRNNTFPLTSKLLETCVPGLVGSIPTQSRQTNHIKGSDEFLTNIDQRALGLFLMDGAQMVPLHFLCLCYLFEQSF